MRHRHTTPFEMCEIKLHVKLPIFVARQWIRHRTANVNEYSARYSVLDKEFYLPRPEDLAVQSTDNKQGRGAELTEEQSAEVLRLLRRDAEQTYQTYESLMGDFNLARELARIDLPLNAYTQWYWKIDLHNLLHFLSLRMHPHAQYEIRVYADAIAEFVKAWVPLSYEAFADYRLGGAFLSRGGIEVVRKLMAGEDVQQEGSGLSKREWAELMKVLKPEG
jgi:thymidylate synthase (FAD)